MANKIQLFGTDLSQPSRTVAWLLRMHNTDFEYVSVLPGSKREGGSRAPEHLKLNPAGTVPVLKHGDVVVNESGAIMVYLAEVLGWNDVYPLAPKDAAARARVNRWMHWHHRNSREFTIGLFAPIMRPDLKFSPESIKEREKMCVVVAKQLEAHLALPPNKFLASTPTPSLADFVVFADIGQCEDLGLFDFGPFPNIRRWMAELRKRPGYAESHEQMMGLKPLVEQAKAKRSAKM